QFLSVTKQGLAAIVVTRGNDACHVILRGGHRRPNYHSEDIEQTAKALVRAGLPPRIMVDCSHGNSGKDHTRQPAVARDLAAQVAEGSRHVFGLMIEGHLVAGRQDVRSGEALTYGQSVTDACLGWDDTLPVLDDLAKAVRARRERRRG
ncbi:MAG: 3-deoxy-7-phosphoheptulonate synthase, partial [Gaiellaceae bacterium]